MNQSDMILEFIDGTLDGGREQNLFDDMARQPDLRAELRQYVMIGEAVRGDREAYTPPADVERRLLGGLGLLPIAEAGGAAVAGTAAGTTGGTVGGAASFFGWFALVKLKTVILPLIVGLLIGGAVGGGGVYLAIGNSSGSETTILAGDLRNAPSVAEQGALRNQDKGTARNNVSAVPSVSAPGQSAASASAQSTTAVRGASGVASLRTESRSVKSGSRTGKIDGGVGAINAAGADDKNPKNIPAPLNETTAATPPNRLSPDVRESSAADRRISTDAPARNVPLIDRTQLLPEEPNVQSSSTVLPMATLTPFSPQTKKHRVALELRKGFLSQPFADNNSRQVNGDFLREDIIAGAYYSPTADWYLGLEAGRERFAQTLFYNREDTLLVEQRPAVAWGGVVFGRNVELFDLPLFLQGTLGASQYGGPMARGRVGFDLLDLFGRETSSAISFPLSVETSSLVYTYNGQYLVTGNWGFSGGLHVRFGL